MKFSTFVIFLLFVSGIFFIFAMMYTEGNQQFSGVNASSAEWNSSYDYLAKVNSTVSPLEVKFKTIQDENAGWFSKLAAGISAMPYAVIIFPQVIFGALELSGGMTTGFLTALAIPGYLILLILVSLLIWGIFKLVEQFTQYPT